MRRKGRVQQTDRLPGGAEATAPARNVSAIREQLRLLRYRYTHIAQAIQSLEKLQKLRARRLQAWCVTDNLQIGDRDCAQCSPIRSRGVEVDMGLAIP